MEWTLGFGLCLNGINYLERIVLINSDQIKISYLKQCKRNNIYLFYL